MEITVIAAGEFKLQVQLTDKEGMSASFYQNINVVHLQPQEEAIAEEGSEDASQEEGETETVENKGGA
jgi:hypothetical protein